MKITIQDFLDWEREDEWPDTPWVEEVWLRFRGEEIEYTGADSPIVRADPGEELHVLSGYIYYENGGVSEDFVPYLKNWLKNRQYANVVARIKRNQVHDFINFVKENTSGLFQIEKIFSKK